MLKPANKRLVTYRSTDRLGRPTPCIPIQGKFLQLYNFSIGDLVYIYYAPNRVTISKDILDPLDGACVAVR